MRQPVATDDYSHGQMMGMLVILTMFENAREARIPISTKALDTIKQVASSDLAAYLNKPPEDILLLVEQQLRSL